MPPVITLKKGLDIPLKGCAPKELVNAPPPKMISLKPTDFRGVTPKLLVKEGDVVAGGAPLFVDKIRPHILFTTPKGGIVNAIVRGEKRKILEIKIDCTNNPPSPLTFPTGKPEELTREQIVETLLQSGCWPCLKQRPYGIIANPDDKPKAIFISAFDSAPLAPDLDFILGRELDALQKGIDILRQLAPVGQVHWSVREHTELSVQNVQIHRFKGPHPAGNTGVQIHHIAPLSKGEVVWTIDPQSVVVIGRLFTTGLLDCRKIVALTGPAAPRPCYLEMVPGTPFHTLPQLGLCGTQIRFISGNALTGDDVGPQGSLGFYHHQITLLPQGDHYELLGWAKILRPKTFSISRSYLSWLTPKKKYALDTNTHGGERAFVMTDVYNNVLPMKLYPVYLLKAILSGDIDKMEAFGIYEVIEEDFALCEFVCPSKIDIQDIIAKGIDLMIKEMS